MPPLISNRRYLLGAIALVLLVPGSVTLRAQSEPLGIVEAKAPDMAMVIQSIERTQQQDRLRLKPYELTRDYKVFKSDDVQPTSEVTAQIDFSNPDIETYKITESTGNARGTKIVDTVLSTEVEAAKADQKNTVDRTNYNFVFLRRENFGIVPEYVLLIVPKRKEKQLIRGQIWVDARTFRIRRIEGIPAKSPSLLIKDIHITLQFASVHDMWLPVSFDAIATVRLLGKYTLVGQDITVPTPTVATIPLQPAKIP